VLFYCREEEILCYYNKTPIELIQLVKHIVLVLFGISFIPFITCCATITEREMQLHNKSAVMYPATRADVSSSIDIYNNRINPFAFGMTSCPNTQMKVIWITLATVDLPISLVTDTILLPLDLWLYSSKSSIKKTENNSKSKASVAQK
jgi:uncharacterized protein YceK